MRGEGEQDRVAPLQMLALAEPAENLAYEYQERGIFDERTVVDGLHVAIAVIHRVEYLVSWNYNHLVRVSTRREVGLLASFCGFFRKPDFFPAPARAWPGRSGPGVSGGRFRRPE